MLRGGGREAILAGADAAGFADLACDALELLGRHACTSR